jgi:hypothetical protein
MWNKSSHKQNNPKKLYKRSSPWIETSRRRFYMWQSANDWIHFEEWLKAINSKKYKKTRLKPRQLPISTRHFNIEAAKFLTIAEKDEMKISLVAVVEREHFPIFHLAKQTTLFFHFRAKLSIKRHKNIFY